MIKVLVLMSTYNGGKYLATQIDSIIAQTNVEISLLVRDDGSTDNTCDILNEYQRYGKLSWYSGANLKPAKSFMDLIMQAEGADFYAFADQDDYWLPSKIEIAVNYIKSLNKNGPILYYSKTTLVDEKLRIMEKQGIQRGPFTTFSQALISSNATGCTMCFNNALLTALKKYVPDFQIMHDAWTHKLCLALGGDVIYDDCSYIYYRQHSNNVIGGTTSTLKRWKGRIKRFFSKSRDRSRCIKEICNGYSALLGEEERNLCALVVEYNLSFRNRVMLLKNKKIRTGDKNVDRMFLLAVLFGRF